MEFSMNTLVNLETRGDTISQSEKTILLNYYGYIKNMNNSEIYVHYNEAQQFRGDFYGLQKKLDILPSTWFVNMLLNKLRGPEEYSGEAGIIRVSSPTHIQNLLQLSTTNVLDDPFDRSVHNY